MVVCDLLLVNGAIILHCSMLTIYGLPWSMAFLNWKIRLTAIILTAALVRIEKSIFDSSIAYSFDVIEPRENNDVKRFSIL